MKRQNLIIFAILLALVGLVLAKRAQEKAAHSSVSTVTASTRPMPRLVDLGASKCIPCKAMAPILEELKSTHADHFETVFIDVWENPDAAEPYNINLIPTQIFLDAEGNELWRHEGFLGKEDILAKWSELGVQVAAADTE